MRMLRRIIHIFIATVLVVSTAGFTITRHYCSGKLVAIAVNTTPESCCDDNGGCCSNESEVYQLQEDYTFVQAQDIDAVQLIDVLLFGDGQFELKTAVQTTSLYLKKGFVPPPDPSAHLADIQFFLL